MIEHSIVIRWSLMGFYGKVWYRCLKRCGSDCVRRQGSPLGNRKLEKQEQPMHPRDGCAVKRQELKMGPEQWTWACGVVSWVPSWNRRCKTGWAGPGSEWERCDLWPSPFFLRPPSWPPLLQLPEDVWKPISQTPTIVISVSILALPFPFFNWLHFYDYILCT